MTKHQHMNNAVVLYANPDAWQSFADLVNATAITYGQPVDEDNRQAAFAPLSQAQINEITAAAKIVGVDFEIFEY